tara:strand:- start:135 stop:1067 length:933 start_codon:yes stop_codon:yes gene_type:complete
MKLSNIKPGLNEVTFISKTMGGDLKLAGHLHAPDDFDSSKKYPTIVFTGPFNQVKEQMALVYGKKLAKKGFIFLAFDHQGYGDSEGQIRHYEYAPARIEGIHDAISFLRMQDFVDRENLYGIGACAGATHMAYTALTDKRMKKIAVVSGMLINPLVQFLVNNKKKSDEILLKANEARQKYYETNVIEPFDALQIDESKDSKIRDQREGYDYYMTERAGAQTNPNYTHLTPEFFVEDMARHSARAIARYITTPTLTIYGSKASTKLFSILFNFAKKKPKKKVVIKGASHVDLYDVDKYVDQVVDHITAYFK